MIGIIKQQAVLVKKDRFGLLKRHVMFLLIGTSLPFVPRERRSFTNSIVTYNVVTKQIAWIGTEADN